MNHPATARPATTVPSTSNLRIRSLEPLVPPARLAALLPLDEAATRTIVEGRQAVERVLAVARGEVIACELPGGFRISRTNQRISITPTPAQD